MTLHDSGYKRLFSHPEMIRDLLLGLERKKGTDLFSLTTLVHPYSDFGDRERATESRGRSGIGGARARKQGIDHRFVYPAPRQRPPFFR